MSWLVRPEGAAGSGRPPAEFATAQAVADALKDGDISPSDDVRGPGEPAFRPIDAHPAFAELAADLDEPPPEPEEETHLDMNPMIDVALVLLIFFILTATYATLTRSLDLPPPQGESDAAQTKKITKDDIKDRVVTVTVRMDADKPLVRLEGKVTGLDELARDLADMVKTGGRKELYLDIGPGVPWWVTVKAIDAGRGADVQRIYGPRRKS